MLRDKINQVIATMHIMKGKPYACTEDFTYNSPNKDIQVGLERKFGWVVSIEAIKKARRNNEESNEKFAG